MQTFAVEEISGIDPRTFRRDYLEPQKPVVIKGLAATQPAGTKWTVDYIRKICEDVEVEVYDNNKNNAASAYTKGDMKMRFGDFLDVMLKEEPTSLRMFLFNMFKQKPELRKDFKCPDLIKGVMGRIGFMFFGAKDIKVRIHQDMDMSNVMLTQFHGRKRVVLVSPEYSRLLYKLPFNTHSLVDLDQPDFEKYPGLRHIKIYECVLQPGDSLFMPSGYWHYITYLDGGFAVSFRKMAASWKWKLRGLISLGVYMPLDKLMNRLTGSFWLSFKERLAHRRAQKELRKIAERGGNTETVSASRETVQMG
jgi:ribosomal protein L16 Arg81 hydroxylase